MRTLSERLESERQRAFVARAKELVFFREALNGEQSLLFMTGQQGVGKSAALAEFHRVALATGHPTALLDASQSPARSSEALERLRAAAQVSRYRCVLFVDSFERLSEPHDAFLAELARGLPENALIVVSSRGKAPASLTLDPAWSRLMVHLDLRPLDEQDAERVLARWNVPRGAFRAILDFARGFPLGLTVAAEVLARSGNEQFTVDRLREAQHAIVSSLLPGSLTVGQQLTLDLCSLASAVTAELLEHVAATSHDKLDAEPSDLFDWLRHQSFLTSAPKGLVPHPLARGALHASLRRERPRRFRRLYRAAREFYVGELESSASPGAQLANLFFLDREAPLVRRLSPESEPVEANRLERANAPDHAAIVELIRAREGDESAAIAAVRAHVDGERFEVIRGPSLTGLLHIARLTRHSNLAPKALEKDPVQALVRQFMSQHPLEGEQEALLFRWFLTGEEYQAPSPIVFSISARQTQIVLANKRIAYSLCVFRRPDEWIGLWKAAALPWSLVGKFTLGGLEYSLHAFMWSRVSLHELLVSGALGGEEIPAAAEQQPALDELRLQVNERVGRLSAKAQLTARETEILSLLCLGNSLEDIGLRLNISTRTVKFHKQNLLRKTGSSSRIELFRKLI